MQDDPKDEQQEPATSSQGDGGSETPASAPPAAEPEAPRDNT
jgi:hypothetical protein